MVANIQLEKGRNIPCIKLCRCCLPLHKQLAGFRWKIYVLKLALTIAINCNNQA